MNTDIISTVATIKAEFVSEFEFIPTRRHFGYRHNDGTITHPYNSKYEARVKVRIGNIVKELVFEQFSHSMPSYLDANDNYHYPDNITYLDLASKNVFEELTNVGIVVDYSEQLVQYQVLVQEAKYNEVLLARLKKWEAIRELKKAYENHWMHDVKNILESDKNKKIQTALLSTTLKKTTKDAFLNNEAGHAIVIYNGIQAIIYKEDESFLFNGNNAYKIRGEEKIDHSDKFTIAEGKKRRAKRVGTLYLKLVEEIDYEIARRNIRAVRRNTEDQERENKRELLQEVSGYPVILQSRNKWMAGHRRGHGYTTTVYDFMIVTKQPRYKGGDADGILLGTNIPTKYVDGKSIELEREFNVKNLTKLNASQFKRILDVYLETIEYFDAIVQPEK